MPINTRIDPARPDIKDLQRAVNQLIDLVQRERISIQSNTIEIREGVGGRLIEVKKGSGGGGAATVEAWRP